MPNSHFEPYLYLPELTDTSVMIAWGGFFFWTSGEHPVEGENFKLIDDEALRMINPPRRSSIGASSEPYDRSREGALVEVFEATSGRLVRSVRAPGTNHAIVTGLTPDTEYTYRVITNGRIDWAAGTLRDWIVEDGFQGLRHAGEYDRRFRTFPSSSAPAGPLTFLVLGDYGRGINADVTDEARQSVVARALQKAVDRFGVRFVLTTGDNIYNHEGGAELAEGAAEAGTGFEDDDWFFSYFQPYRYILNRIPVYPSSGNHDTGESDNSDDQKQLFDNFYLRERFVGPNARGPASFDPGIFYRFRYGSTIEFVCLDTSKKRAFFAERFFRHQNHRRFLDETFVSDGMPWRIPFCHHPPFCAGPQHGNTEGMLEHIVGRCRSAGVRAFFSGHEHNFQYSKQDPIHFFVTGGGGDLRLTPPLNFRDAFTQAWGKGGHFLVVTVDGEVMTVRVVGELDNAAELTALPLTTPTGATAASTFVIRR